MCIHIIKPGILTTIQDGGRYGYRAMGITPGGVMDVFAAAKAQQLALNEQPAALLEMHYPAPEMLFETDALIGIAGGDFDMYINNKPAANWQSHIIKAGSTIKFMGLKKGFRSCMAVHGGITVPAWLGSYATHTVTKIGGYQGRVLQKADRLPLNRSLLENLYGYKASIQPAVIEQAYYTNMIDCLDGPEFDWLPADQQQLLREGKAAFTIEASSNRMACGLKGPLFTTATPVNMLSSAVSFGTVQLLPNGALLILMADHQATGGYPRILQVCTAALPALAQMRPGQTLRLRMITLRESEQSLIQLHEICGGP